MKLCFGKKNIICSTLLLVPGMLSYGKVTAADDNNMSLQQVTEAEITRARLKQEELKKRATQHILRGQELMHARNYKQALEEFMLALGLDPENKEALDGRKSARAYLEAHSTSNTATQAVNREKIRQQYSIAEVKQFYSLAQKFYQDAMAATPAVTPEQQVKVISSQMHLLSQAEDSAIKASLRLEGLGANVSSSIDKSKIKQLVLDIRDYRKKLQSELDATSRTESLQEVQKEKKLVESVETERRNRLLSEAAKYIDKQEYIKAQNIYNQLLRVNPGDDQVKKLKTESSRMELRARTDQVTDMLNEHRRINMENIERSTVAEVSLRNPLRFPSDWASMVESKKIRGATEVVGMAVQKTRRVLENSYSFEFVETEFQLILDTIRTRTGLNIVPSGIGGDSSVMTESFTFSFRDMRLSNILKWITRRTGLRYDIDSNGIVKIFSKEQSAQKATTTVYDIRDIAYAITDAKKMPTDDDDDDDDDDDEKGAEDTISLGDILKNFINTSSDTEGTTKIDVQEDGQLILTATPDIRTQIEKLLQQLRTAKTIQVSVSARFLTLQDTFWEEFKSEFKDWNNSYNSDTNVQIQNQSRNQGGAAVGTVTSRGVANVAGTDIYTTAANATNFLVPGANNGAFNPQTYYTEVTGSFFNGDFNGMNSVFANDVPGNRATAGLIYHIQQLGFIGGLQCQWFLQMIRESSRADQLYAPQVVVYNNKYGWIKFVQRWPYISNYQAGDSDVGLVAILSYIDQGCTLQVRPNVSSDKKYITVDAQPRVILVRNPGTQNLTYQYVTAAGVPVLPVHVYPITIPNVFRHDAKTYAIIPDGGAILMTGLSTNVNARGRTGTPLLEDLPIVGNAFSSRYYQKSKQSYACLISAKMIILDEEESRQTGVK